VGYLPKRKNRTAVHSSPTSIFPLTLKRLNDQVFSVNTPDGEHVGNLKRVGGVWKFKAVGYGESGEVMPGHGPLTDQHNLAFAVWDEALICAQLARQSVL
jgi:hypothetical protein